MQLSAPTTCRPPTSSRRAAARATGLAAALLAGAASAARAHDLLPSLRDAASCGAPGCEAPPHAVADPAPAVTIPAGARHALVLRIPARAPRLAIELDADGAELALAARQDGTASRPLLRVRADGRVARTVDLGALAGRVVELGLRVAGPGDVRVHQLALTHGAPAATPAPPRRPWNVVVYVIDTLRADHLGCYGSPLGATPRLDALAGSAVRFAHAVSQSSWTLPSIASILTGRVAQAHGATGPAHALRADVPTLPELLAAAGWETAAFVTNYLGSDAFGLGRGFDVFRFYRERGATRPKVYLRSDALHRRIVRWLDRGPRRPFLLWVHATDPHFPYLPPRRHTRWSAGAAPARRELESLVDVLRPLHNGNEAWGTRPAPVTPETVGLLRDLYAGEVRAADHWFGRLLDALAARALLDDTLVIVTSDHGEEFLEHGGIAHGQTLHREVLDVPLLVRLPGGVGGGTVVEGLARHVDLVPTVLALVGVPAPAALDGVPLLGPDAATPDEAHAAVQLGRFDQDAVVASDWKAIRNRRTARLRLFDTATDPGEQVDLAPRGGLRLRYATRRLDELATTPQRGPRVGGDRLERLRALGYVAE